LEEQLGLVGPAWDPRLVGESIPFAEVVSLPLALPRRAQSLRQTLGTEARRRGLTLEVPVEVDSLGVMRELAIRGLAYTVLAPASVRAERAAGRLGFRPIEPPVRRRLVLVTVAGRPLRRVARVLARLVRLEAARLIDSGVWEARSPR
jgi:LysR family transcriptional regulator, nitrogen assimilation regulatory protein